MIPGGFLSGIAIHSFFPLAATPALVYWIFLFLFCLLLILKNLDLPWIKGRKEGIFAWLILVSLFILGLLRFDLSIPKTVVSSEDEFVGIVRDSSYGRFGWQAYVNTGGNTFLVRAKRNLTLGATVSFVCKPKVRTQGEDDYHQYLSFYRKSQADCSPKQVSIIEPPAWWDVRQMFADLKVWINRRIMSVLPGDEGALIAGMLYGERGMTQQSNDLFRNAGLTHLIAVSGSNITIVASMIFALLLSFGLWRRQAFWGTTIVLGSYVMLTGFSASVARAAAMGWLVLLAGHLGRKAQTWRLLIISASILCLIDPWMLGFDAGFALSFLATVGLMIWTPIINRRLGFLSFDILREAAATSIAATIMTAPYIALAFGRVSLAGLFTNLIAVPLVPWAMLFGALAAAWGQFFGWQVVAMPALGVAKLIFFSAKISEYVPFLNLEMQSANLFLLVATYALLVKIYLKLRKENDLYTETRLIC